MPKQLTFDLPVRAALGRADFFVSDANRQALDLISDWQNWAGGKLVLCGPKGSGKTHLAHVWANDARAQVVHADALAGQSIVDLINHNPRIVVEDVDRIAGKTDAENALFHLHNLALAEGGLLLLTGLKNPAQWGLELPDLQSRVQGTGLAQLTAPDDALLSAVMVKLFTDRQIDVSPDLIQYLAPRIERSFDAAGRTVAALDELALSEARPIGRKLAARVLDKMELGNA